MPQFVTQRTLYEARERPSKTYSWQVFILSNIIVEIPWNAFTAVLMFVAWYYPIGLNQNAIEAGQVAERGALMFLFLLAFTIFGGTLAQMVIAGLDTAEAAGNLATLMFSLSFVFCGVLATPDTFPRFWIFMYRLSPFTYIVSGVLSVGLANSHVVCDPEELLHFSPGSTSTCSEYLGAYIADVGGYLTPESMNSTSTCAFCTRSDTNVFLENMNIEYGDRWRNFGILLGYILFNITAAIGLYWLARVPKVKKEKLKKN
jgi:ATP-binding cassette, subfamily G (WHITE), member 2, PDR